MVSLADLRARNIHPTWQEAVAVVQELLHSIVAAHGAADDLPDLRHIALIANGDVVALPGSPAVEHPVRHLATLIQVLLDGVAAPPQLEEFIAANVTDPPELDSVEEFSMQLAFFERPGRRSDVEALVARAMSTDAELRAEEELRRLKAKTAEAAEQHTPETPEPPPARNRLPSRHVAVVAVLIVVALVAATGAWWLGRSPSGASESASSAEEAVAPVTAGLPPASQAPDDGTPAGDSPAASSDQTVGTGTAGDATSAGGATAPSLASRAIQAIRDVISPGSAERSSSSAPAPDTTAAAQKQEPAGERRASASRGPARASKPRTPAAASPAPQPPAQVRTEVTTPPVTGEPPMSVATATDLRTIVYTAADDDVMPAILIRPLLPATPPPDVPPSQIGTLELVVNEQGDVERVRLISPSNRYHERMLVAHAKTWKFRPAIREGRPVKFRTMVRLTI